MLMQHFFKNWRTLLKKWPINQTKRSSPKVLKIKKPSRISGEAHEGFFTYNYFQSSGNICLCNGNPICKKAAIYEA
jgi:hypothetical protein